VLPMSVGGQPSVGSLLRTNGGLGYLVILAVQYGFQPMLAKRCIIQGTLTSSLVLGAELMKVLGCIAILYRGHDGSARRAFKGWSLRSAFVTAGLPSVSYLCQNFCVQVAYQNLDGVTFNILNQSKAIFTAIFSFLITGRRQSQMQCLALAMVTVASVLAVAAPGNTSKSASEPWGGSDYESYLLGVTCVLSAAGLSGLGSGITEWALTRQKRNNYVLSLEIATMGCVIIVFSLLFNLTADSEVSWREGLFVKWELCTFLPVFTQGLAGIVVGIITQVAGGVRKILATICGLVLTCIVQQLLLGSLPPPRLCMAVPLVAIGIYLHSAYPPRPVRTAVGAS